MPQVGFTCACNDTIPNWAGLVAIQPEASSHGGPRTRPGGQRGRSGRLPSCQAVVHPPSPRAITSQSPVPIPFPQLQAPVSKSRDRGVIGKADAESRWPFRVLRPVVATGCAEGVYVAVSVRHSRATRAGRTVVPKWHHFRPKISPLSQSRRSSYGGVASAQSVVTLSQLAPRRRAFRDRHANPIRPVVICPINFLSDGQLAR